MSDPELKLQNVRAQIDALDEKLLVLLNRRADLAHTVANIKANGAHDEDYYRPGREAEVLLSLLEKNEGPLSNEVVTRLYREIMSACRAVQARMCIAFLGPEGTFTEAAAFKHFGRAVETMPLESIDAVFREVASGNSDYGVVPVENSTEGIVSHTLDMFVESRLSICGEVELRIHHHLLGAGVLASDFTRITRVYSNQQSFAQCRKWLDRHLPKAERVAVSSNAEAARRAAAEADAVAIAGEVAADIYGLTSLVRNVEDEPDNTTRFLVIGERTVPPTGRDKTSILMSAADRPGALYHLLEPLAYRRISMTRIESRPARSAMWAYVFFVDIEGHTADQPVSDALAEIGRNASLLKILGSYPKAVV